MATIPPSELYLSATDGEFSGTYYNDVTFKLPRAIFARDGFSLYISVLSFTCPHTFKIVNEYNCSFNVDDASYSITIGNYSIYDLVAAITSSVPNITCSFDSISLKATVTCSVSITVSGGICELLGIPENSSGTSISSTHTVACNGVQSIFVDSNLVGDNVDTSSINSRGLLCRIINQAAPLSVIQYEDSSSTSGILLYDGIIHTVRIILQDDKRQPLLCSLPWQATIQVRQVQTGRSNFDVVRPDSLSLLQNYIKG
jgi:hypothetical protein